MAQLSDFGLRYHEHYSKSPNGVAVPNGMTTSDALNQSVQPRREGVIVGVPI